MNTTENRPHVIIVGAGYAGTIAANKLASSGDVTVTVINPRPDFVERIRLHQFVAATHPAVRPLAEVLSAEVELVIDSVTQIGTDAVDLKSGGRRTFDYLIYAVGSHSRYLAGSEAAYSVADFTAATALRKRIDELGEGARVSVIGGGLTAIEAASELAEAKPSLRVSLFTDRPIVESYPQRSRRYVEQTLVRLGVTIQVGSSVERIHADRVVLSDGTEHASDCTILAAGMTAPDLARNSGFTVDDIGRVRTDASLRSIDNPRVFAVGDAAALPVELGTHIRMACATAIPTGAHAADSILAQIAGGDTDVFSLGYLGQCVSLGRHAGILQLSHRDETAVGFAFKRGTAAKIKESICRGTVTFLTKPRFVTWVRGPKTREMISA
ncbi:MAG: FAD-dependent oxidoreductase [Nocardiaceae bacterium]|nr:FAD-dependent oxidoreductase [Nocardiaceae bacterium]